ncbi:hypothetical protein Pelo_12208 [Pelomyxa schiedti]|nr:hypothetical protein Pelo_12208 [Pelomyxa schiedti]
MVEAVVSYISKVALQVVVHQLAGYFPMIGQITVNPLFPCAWLAPLVVALCSANVGVQGISSEIPMTELRDFDLMGKLTSKMFPREEEANNDLGPKPEIAKESDMLWVHTHYDCAGKTSIRNQYVMHTFSSLYWATIGADFLVHDAHNWIMGEGVKVTATEALQWCAKGPNFHFFEVSAKDGTNITNFLQSVWDITATPFLQKLKF